MKHKLPAFIIAFSISIGFLSAQATNDDCGNAKMLLSENDGIASSLLDLSTATYDPTYENQCNGPKPALWFKFIAKTGDFAINTGDPNFQCSQSDSELFIAYGDDCDNLTEIYCDDDDNSNCDHPICMKYYNCGGNEFYEGTVPAGTTVYVMITRDGPSSDDVYEILVAGAISPSDIPTLSQWSLIFLGLLLIIFGIVASKYIPQVT